MLRKSWSSAPRRCRPASSTNDRRASRGASDEAVPRRMPVTVPYGADLNFSVYQPTRVVFGDGTVGELALECKRLGIERAMIVTDRVMRERTDVVARVEKALGARLGAIYDGVVPDTGVACIDEGARQAKEHGCDGLISVGGGSSIDTAKGMAIVMTEGG